MINLNELFLDDKDSKSKEYKSGWNDAVCWLNENFLIKSRNGEQLDIKFNISIDVDKLIKNIREEQDAMH